MHMQPMFHHPVFGEWPTMSRIVQQVDDTGHVHRLGQPNLADNFSSAECLTQSD